MSDQIEGWISVSDRAPGKGETVQVLVDKTVDWKEAITERDLLSERGPRRRHKVKVKEIYVSSAILRYHVGSLGYLHWECPGVGAKFPDRRYITHWKPLDPAPESTPSSRALEERLRRRENDDPNWDKE